MIQQEFNTSIKFVPQITQTEIVTLINIRDKNPPNTSSSLPSGGGGRGGTSVPAPPRTVLRSEETRQRPIWEATSQHSGWGAASAREKGVQEAVAASFPLRSREREYLRERERAHTEQPQLGVEEAQRRPAPHLPSSSPDPGADRAAKH